MNYSSASSTSQEEYTHMISDKYILLTYTKHIIFFHELVLLIISEWGMSSGICELTKLSSSSSTGWQS